MWLSIQLAGVLVAALAAGGGPPSGRASEESGRATVEGRIAAIRESDPPQLTLDTDEGEWEIAVGKDTVIEGRGWKQRLQALRRGSTVSVEGARTGRRALSATRIRLLEESTGLVVGIRSDRTLIVADSEQERTFHLPEGAVIRDSEGATVMRQTLKKGAKVRVRFYRRYDRESKETFFDASSVTISEASSMGSTVEGRISEVRESFPPQLVIDTADGEVEVAVSEETVIQAGGEERGYEVLRRGKRVRIAGERTGRQTLSATRIQVLD